MDEKQKILIIDDEEDARSYYMAILEDEGFDFATAENGKEGLQKALEEKPDLIFLDLMMPGGSGIKFFNEIKESEELHDIPVVMITGATQATGVDMKSYVLERPYHDRKVQATGKDTETKPVEFLEKPVDPDDLIQTVNKVLGRKAEEGQDG